MRYVLKERIFSLRDSYYIRDEDGNTQFEVTGRLISLRDSLTLRDRHGATLATITQRRLALRPVYTIRCKGQPDAVIKRDFINIVREGFAVNMEGDVPDLRIQGNILDHEYTIKREGDTVAQASKKWISLRDSYVVDVQDEADTVLVLTCAIVVDRVSHEDEDED